MEQGRSNNIQVKSLRHSERWQDCDEHGLLPIPRLPRTLQLGEYLPTIGPIELRLVLLLAIYIVGVSGCSIVLPRLLGHVQSLRFSERSWRSCLSVSTLIVMLTVSDDSTPLDVATSGFG
jgi:hypothetical protein